MPTKVETTMETPGTEGMTTTAGTQQQQKQHINNSLNVKKQQGSQLQHGRRQ
jgi:hypothetical protein